ncbi:ribonuclease p-related protein [Echinococcus granulosus]|uniref:Ribonuclease P:MRP protein subunit RPP1 n=1 Tax=Echinococcus granulosus TaxID=6210 RepID=U6IV89_ECHGR|nr:ribonuclease p-related protein [Echinococcus granulosus]EUB64749.1 ribonuclease p-related protein [Echinococcus granulosus]CDS15726.1 ribonuclease P:MRP protein subunit RPP1 [Echinococcus granulosus]
MDSKYYDLDIPRKTVSPELIARLLDCEYLYICINTTVSVDEFNFKDKKKSAKEGRQQMRASLIEKLTPLTVSELTNLLEQGEQFRSSSSSKLPALTPPRLFNRLTLACVDTDIAGLFFKEFADSIRKFDVVAFEPMSSAALTYVIETLASLPIDLITVNPVHSFSSDFRPTGKQCNQCLRRGVYLDLPLSPSLFRSGASSSTRLALAALLTHLDSVCRFHFSRLVVVTSGAQTGWEVRRPQAVASVLCAICPTVARGSASLVMQQTNPWQALSHGLTRCESKTSHGAAILLRLLADPSVIEVVQTSALNEADLDKKKAPLPCVTAAHRSSTTEETNITSPKKRKRKMESS